MNIKIYYTQGKIESYSTDSFTTPEIFKRDCAEPNIMTEFLVRLDLLNSQGLMVQCIWYSAEIDNTTPHSIDREIDANLSIYHAVRMPGRFIRIIPKEYLSKVDAIELDGELVALRVEDKLVLMTERMHHERLSAYLAYEEQLSGQSVGQAQTDALQSKLESCCDEDKLDEAQARDCGQQDFVEAEQDVQKETQVSLSLEDKDNPEEQEEELIGQIQEVDTSRANTDFEVLAGYLNKESDSQTTS